MSLLLAISLGPVQSFIAAARKTSDLLAGSRLLSDAAKAAAQAVADHPGSELIFPDTADHASANKIVALVPDGQVQSIAGAAEKAARQSFLTLWEDASRDLAGLGIDDPRAVKQLDSFLEFFAAWGPYHPDHYQENRQRVERLLSARKSLRNFEPPLSEPGRPKSPLDPSLESVLQRISAGDRAEEARRRFPLKKSESFDAISLLKRSRRQKDVPSTSEMAARSFDPADPEVNAALAEMVARAGGRIDRGDILFDRTYEDERAELEALGVSRTKAAELRKQFWNGREPVPYYAIIAADGDRMGKAIDAMKSPQDHQKFSEALYHFSESARDCEAKQGAHGLRRRG